MNPQIVNVLESLNVMKNKNPRILSLLSQLAQVRADKLEDSESFRNRPWSFTPERLAKDDEQFCTSVLREINAGWNDREIFLYYCNMEDFNPDLDEDTALRNMDRIRKSVRQRLENQGNN